MKNCWTLTLLLPALWALSKNAGAGMAQLPAAQSSPSPLTCLYDTRAAADKALEADVLAKRPGWGAVKENDLTHTFSGDTVMMNDRLAVVIRTSAGQAEIYWRGPHGFVLRASLTAGGTDGPLAEPSAIKIIENSSAAIALDATWQPDSPPGGRAGQSVSLRLRIVAGAPVVEVKGVDKNGHAANMGRVRVSDQSQFVVVPDFFGDDLVFDPSLPDGKGQGAPGAIRLPTENALLGLADHGQFILACLWPSAEQNVNLLTAMVGGQRLIAGYEIDLPRDKGIFLAAMEGPGIWHARPVKDDDLGRQLALAWKPPFAAKWRATFAWADGKSRSLYFNQADPAPAATQGPAPAGPAAAGLDCRLTAEGATVRIYQAAGPAGIRPAGAPRCVIVYPADRAQATPLTEWCFTDAMRNTLGCGPCQYVLDAEGLGSGQATTPDQAARWIERQFEKKAARRDGQDIAEQLQAMTGVVEAQARRIQDYRDLLRQVVTMCQAATRPAGTLGNLPPSVAKVLAIAAEGQPPPTGGTTATAGVAPSQLVKELAGQVRSLADKDDALEQVRSLCGRIRQAGADQDYALAKLRMSVRLVRLRCRNSAAAGAPEAALLRAIDQKVGQLAVKK